MKPTITTAPCSVEQILGIYIYDRDTGLFVWRQNSFRQKNAGKVAGRLCELGYRRIYVNKKSYFAHRIVWYVETGVYPVMDIDHIDCNPLNNAFSNLRLADYAQNNHNRKLAVNNKSGFKGVHWHKASGRWRASIGAKGRQIELGRFSDPALAAAAYQRAAINLHGDFARFS